MKNIVSIMLTSSLVLGGAGSVFATEETSGPDGDSTIDMNVEITLEQQEDELLNEANTEEEIVLVEERFEEHAALVKAAEATSMENNKISTLAANTASGSLSVPYYKQEKSYWCGPATTKQTIQLIKGSSSSQTSIASAIGTTSAGSVLSSMVKYVNANQSKHKYLVINSPSESLIQSIAEYGVRNKAPAMGRLKIAKGGNWTYNSAGHYMNMSGYRNYGKEIRVTDPYIGWVNASSGGSYYVTSKEFHTATKNHFANQISY